MSDRPWRERRKRVKKEFSDRSQCVVALGELIAHLCRLVITVVCAAKVCPGAVSTGVFHPWHLFFTRFLDQWSLAYSCPTVHTTSKFLGNTLRLEHTVCICVVAHVSIFVECAPCSAKKINWSLVPMILERNHAATGFKL